MYLRFQLLNVLGTIKPKKKKMKQNKQTNKTPQLKSQEAEGIGAFTTAQGHTWR